MYYFHKIIKKFVPLQPITEKAVKMKLGLHISHIEISFFVATYAINL